MSENKFDGDDLSKRSSGESHNEDQFQVVLPCSVEHFGSFVSGLLGKPQILRGEVVGQFDVAYGEIANTFYLVNYRVSQQNHGTLIHLSITVLYDNGVSVTHNTVERFKDYHPLEDSRPTEVVLSFTYLLSFPGRSAPEKQGIEVVFSTQPNENRIRRKYYNGGLYEYKVEYTDRTWATDIAGLLGSHGKKLVEGSSKVKTFVHNYHEEIILYTTLLMFGICLFLWSQYSVEFIDELSEKSATHKDLYVNISEYLIRSVSALGILAIISYAITNFSRFSLYIPMNSFITLVESDNKRRNKQMRKEKIRWLYAIGAWIFSIVAGLVANYLNASGYFLP